MTTDKLFLNTGGHKDSVHLYPKDLSESTHCYSSDTIQYIHHLACLS